MSFQIYKNMALCAEMLLVRGGDNPQTDMFHATETLRETLVFTGVFTIFAV